ncbi:ATP-binding protein [Streptomyces albulus]|uniref:ATP-binding protein n=1 Tax=Streptomyces noursei TaxID=1971 RepID=UPI001F2CB7CE|nr:ATP-binding protein [Streptomyces noursei]MCE4947278.1 ATP-binding protein [Streptomyces noursei]
MTPPAPALPVVRVFRPDGILLNERFEIAERAAGQSPARAEMARVPQMRRCATAMLRYHGLMPMSDDVALVLGELVGNAIVHSRRGPLVTVQLRVAGRRLIVAVGTSKASGRPVLRHQGLEAEHGRGLRLVDGIAQGRGGRWGVDAASEGVKVWCDLPLDGAPA